MHAEEGIHTTFYTPCSIYLKKRCRSIPILCWLFSWVEVWRTTGNIRWNIWPDSFFLIFSICRNLQKWKFLRMEKIQLSKELLLFILWKDSGGEVLKHIFENELFKTSYLIGIYLIDLSWILRRILIRSMKNWLADCI